MIDISPADEAIVNEILKKYVPKFEVRVFGSRHKWTTKPYSDLDIAIVGDAKLDKKTLYALQEAFEESELNFRVDVLDWYAISDEFRAIIEQGYTVIQEKDIDNQVHAGWVVKKLGDVIDFNPTEKLPKGSVAKKIAMEKLHPYTRKITNYEVSSFTGGSKFKNRDTLLARITPCLENGKTSYVDILEDNEIGFGSTEFIVLREKENITDSKFIYYLSISPGFRDKAIKSMTGSSGRQRVQSDELMNHAIAIPPPDEQKKIAAILSSLDDKIELNQQINKKLEEMAQAIFKEWFIDFNFPDENGNPYRDSGGAMIDSELGQIPASWSVGYFNNLILDTVGGDWGKEVSQGNYNQEVLCVRGADINELKIGNKSNAPKRYILEKNLTNKKLNESEIVIEISGGSPTQSTGRTILITNELLNQFTTPLICTNFCRKLKFSSASESLFCYLHLNYLYDNNVFFNYENGTTGVKNLDTSNLFSKHQIILPTKKILELFKENIFSLINGIYSYGKQSQKISNIRDTLLPKLMLNGVIIND